jgi:hypothetical protein
MSLYYFALSAFCFIGAGLIRWVYGTEASGSILLFLAILAVIFGAVGVITNLKR